MNDTTLDYRIVRRLSRGRADEIALARWCDIHVRALRPLLARMAGAQRIREVGGKYALPFNPLSPAGPVVVPQFRWGSTRLG